MRFDGPHVQLAGRVVRAKSMQLSGSSGVADLPADTLAAVGVGGADQMVETAWASMRAMAETQGGTAELDDQLAALQRDHGISVPGDITAAVGDRLTFAFGGLDHGTPKIAARTSGSRPAVEKLVGVGREVAAGSSPIATATAGQDTVVASSRAYADAVATGSGLGSSAAFVDSVPDAKGADQVGFVDIAGIVSVLGDQLGLDQEARANLQPAAVGYSARVDGDTVTLWVRLSTR